MPALRRGLLLIVLAELLVLMGTIGLLYEGNLVWVNRLEHPFVLGCIAAGVFGVGVLQFITKRWQRLLVGFISGCVVVGWFLIGLFWLMLVGTWPVGHADAPGDAYQAVVVEGNDWIDTVLVRVDPTEPRLDVS